MPSLELVDRTLDVLELVAEQHRISATEMARELGVSKAAAFRVAQSLAAREWLVQREDRSYELGPALRRLDKPTDRAATVADLLRPFMKRLHEVTTESIHLTRLDGRHIVYVDQLVSPRPVRSVVTVGARSPAHAVSPGLAQLACLPPQRIERLLASGLPRYTAATIDTGRRLRAEFERIRERGWAVNIGGFRPDVGGVGTAIVDPHTHLPLMALSICCPTYRLSAGVTGEHGELLLGVAREAQAAVDAAFGADHAA